MSNLRQKLDELTQCEDLEKQVSLMEELRKEFDHHIRLVQKFDSDVEKQYTCFMHALSVPHAEEVKDLLRRNPNNIFGTKFVQELIDRGIISPSQTGSVVIYFRDESPVHAGKFSHKDSKVASKWGIGHLWEHDILEVPASYGERHEFFSSLEPKIVIRKFQEFATKEQNQL